MLNCSKYVDIKSAYKDTTLPDIILIMCDIFKGGVNSFYLRPLLYFENKQSKTSKFAQLFFIYVNLGNYTCNREYSTYSTTLLYLNVRVMNI